MSADLSEQVNKAVELLTEVTKAYSETSTGPLNPRAVKNARGVQFTFVHKAGLGLGYTNGSGFSLNKLSTENDGTAKWSAPCFLGEKSIAVGALIGVHDTASITCLLSQEAANYFTTRGTAPSLGAEVNLTAPKLGWVVEMEPNMLEVSGDALSVGVANGTLVDCSVAVGATKVDAAKNKEVYGRDIEVSEILGGSVPAPPEFEKLFAKLNEVILSCKNIKAGPPDEAPIGTFVYAPNVV